MMPERWMPRIHVDCSEHPCATVLRAECEARPSRDLAAFARLLTQDVTWHVPGDNAIAGIYRGINELPEDPRI
jgi:ketosteroid isomerase-like protein